MLEKKINPIRNKDSKTPVIFNGIKDELKTALKEKDSLKLTVLRGMLAGFTNELISQKKKLPLVWFSVFKISGYQEQQNCLNQSNKFIS